MNKPLVSVVIPAYNAEKYLHESIFSATMQKWNPVEIIVVNDGSTDKTQNIIDDWIMSTENVKEIHLDKNTGCGNALRIGFEAAEGNYICWLSADDMFIDVNKTRRQVKVMQQRNADWSYFSQCRIGATVKDSKVVTSHYLQHCPFLNKKIESDNGLLFLSLLFHNPINGSTTMFKRETILNYGMFDSELKRADADGDLWLRYTLLGAKIARIKGRSNLYRTHSEQLSRDVKTMVYGTEVTRCRALKSIEDTIYCFDALLNKNKWILYLMFILKQYKKRPFVSWMLCHYVRKHSALFPPEFVKFCGKIFRKVDMYIKNNLSWTLFNIVLENAMESEEYQKHLERFNNK